MKPVDGNFAQNALEYGVAGLNIDGCRIGTGEDKASGGNTGQKHLAQVYGEYEACSPTNYSVGRFPANVILDGSDEVTEQFPETTSGAWRNVVNRPTNGVSKGYENKREREDREKDSGSASRFFKECKIEEKEDTDDQGK